MRSYQSVLILKSDLDEAQVDQALEKIAQFISKYNGSSLKVERWGKKRLAYRVKKSRFGYYLNIYHTCDGSKISSLEADFKLYDLILKFLVIRLEGNKLESAMSREYEENSEAKHEGKKEKSSVGS